MILKNNRAPLLCYFNLYGSFHSHLWIQTGDTVQKLAIWVEIDDFFLAMWPWNLTDDLENQQGTAPKWYQALCIISSPYVKSNTSYVPETANLDFDLCNLDFWLLNLNFCIDITSVIGNHSWNFMMIPWWEHSEKGVKGTASRQTDRQVDRQTDRQTDRKTEYFFKAIPFENVICKMLAIFQA